MLKLVNVGWETGLCIVSKYLLLKKALKGGGSSFTVGKQQINPLNQVIKITTIRNDEQHQELPGKDTMERIEHHFSDIRAKSI